jgi:hypothetical protein
LQQQRSTGALPEREPFELVMAAPPKSGGTYDTLIKLLLIGDSGESQLHARGAEARARCLPLER